MRTPLSTIRGLGLVIALVPALALAAETDGQGEACVRAQLAGVGLAQQEIDDLFSGRVTDPHAYVKSRLSEEVVHTIGTTCFPADADAPPSGDGRSGGATSPPASSPPPDGGGASISPTQRACVTQFLDEDTLDRLLRGEIRPENVLSRERMEEIGTACFGGAPPGAHADGTASGPSSETTACVERIFGKARVAELRAGAQPTPEEIRQAETSGCFPQGSGPTAPPDGEQESCARAALGEARYEELRAARGPITLSPEESAKVQGCFPGDTGGGPLPSGEPHPFPSGEPYPIPSGEPYPTPPSGGDCVTVCEQQGIPRDQCEAGCLGQGGGASGGGFSSPFPGTDPRSGWTGSDQGGPAPTEWPTPTFETAPPLTESGQVYGAQILRAHPGWAGYVLGLP